MNKNPGEGLRVRLDKWVFGELSGLVRRADGTPQNTAEKSQD